jgi:hypothetical protein
MNSLLTDREILRCIIEMYAPSYPGTQPGEIRGKNDPYLPLKINEAATRLGCSPEMPFGRLYYHLDAKFSYTKDGNVQVHIFALKVGAQMHCVNFPFLAAVLADKDEEHKRQLWSLGVAITASVLSVASIVAQVITAK